MLLIIQRWQEKLCYRYLRRIMRTMWLLLSDFSSDRQQPPNTPTLQRRTDSCDIFWHRESPKKNLWQPVSDVRDVFSLQNSAEEEVVQSLSSKTRLIISLFFFFRGLSSFLGRHQKKSCCVWGKVQRNAKRSNKTNNGVEKKKEKKPATLLTRSDKISAGLNVLSENSSSGWRRGWKPPPSEKTNRRMICLFYAALITYVSVYATCKMTAAAQSGEWHRIYAATWRCRLLLQPADKTWIFPATRRDIFLPVAAEMNGVFVATERVAS